MLPTRHVAIDDDCSGKGLAFTKNNWPADWLVWWGFPDSWGFPLVSAAIQMYPVHCRSLAYMEQLSFRLRNSNSPMAPTILLIDRGRKVCRKAVCSERTTWSCYEDDDALQVRCLWSQFAMLHDSSFAFGVEWIFFFMKTTMHYKFDAFGANLRCCMILRSPLGSSEFSFFENHVDQIWDRLGIRVEWQKLRTFRRVRREQKLGHNGGFRKCEHQTLSLLHGHHSASGQRWPGTFGDSSSNEAKPEQRCKFRLVCDSVCMVTWMSIQMRKRAKVLRIQSQKTMYS